MRLRKALSLRSDEPSKLLLESVEKDTVTKAGTVVYRCGETTLKDTGQDLILGEDYEREALVVALTAAKEKFGDSPLIINGSDEFKNDLLIVAATMNLGLKFQDKALQASYLKLKEKENDRSNYGTRNRGTGRSLNGNNGARRGYRTSNGSDFANQLYADLPEDLAKLPSESIARVLLSQPNEEGSGDSMFEMPERGMGNPGELGVVQMSSIVRGDVSVNETEQHTGLRHLSRTDERERDRRRSSVERYVKERNHKREFIESVPEHRTYTSDKDGNFIYKGLRHVDGVSMILLQRGEVIYVKDVPNAQVNFIKTLSVGTNIRIEDERITILQNRRKK